MTASEIELFARMTAMDELCQGKRVAIRRDGDGFFLLRDGSWGPDLAAARSFDYELHNVRSQIEAVQMQHGHKWTAVPKAVPA